MCVCVCVCISMYIYIYVCVFIYSRMVYSRGIFSKHRPENGTIVYTPDIYDLYPGYFFIFTPARRRGRGHRRLISRPLLTSLLSSTNRTCSI